MKYNLKTAIRIETERDRHDLIPFFEAIKSDCNNGYRIVSQINVGEIWFIDNSGVLTYYDKYYGDDLSEYTILNGIPKNWREEIKISKVENLDMKSLFHKHVEFSSKTFTNSTWRSSLIGLRREIDEVEQAIDSNDYENIPEEYADCFLYLFDSMNRAKVPYSQLIESIQKKIEKNKNRNWKPNEDGSYSHIKPNNY